MLFGDALEHQKQYDATVQMFKQDSNVNTGKIDEYGALTFQSLKDLTVVLAEMR